VNRQPAPRNPSWKLCCFGKTDAQFAPPKSLDQAAKWNNLFTKRSVVPDSSTQSNVRILHRQRLCRRTPAHQKSERNQQLGSGILSLNERAASSLTEFLLEELPFRAAVFAENVILIVS
jgi:hypothetical protein